MFLCVLPALLAWDSSPGAPAALRAAAFCRGGRTGISGPGPEPRIGTENIILAVLDPTVYGDAAAPESLARYLRRLSDGELSLTLPQFGSYQIAAPETLTLTLMIVRRANYYYRRRFRCHRWVS